MIMFSQRLYKKPLTITFAFGVALCVVFTSCGHKPTIDPAEPRWADNDRQSIAEPEWHEPSLVWTSIDRTSFDQAVELLDIDRNTRKLVGRPGQATNINSFDEVPNSSWFTNMHGMERMSAEKITRGPQITAGPDTTGVWVVFRPKVGGATPGFWIEDIRGNQYIIKFDPVNNPEMSTAAAAMGSRYFYACGYNVPQETIVYWHPRNLRIREGATIRNRAGIKRPFTEQDLEDILKAVKHEPDGRIRSIASLSLGKSGKVKGPFSYCGTRKDDPNDWYRHENRRELRGLYVIASLVNHYDAKDHNSLDVYVEEGGRHFLRHYLMDFGSTFGSDGNSPKHPKKGYANSFDVLDVIVSFVTFGLKPHPWEYAKPPQFASIGYFESDIFEPNKFDCIFPNPAFENMTKRDAYWGAKIVMAFRDDDLRALIDAGQYSDPAAEAYLLKTLIERRDKIGRHWFGKVNPLDNFEIEDIAEGLQISFDDLAIKYGLESDNAVYSYRIRYQGGDVVEKREQQSRSISLSGEDIDRMASLYTPESQENNPEDHLYEIKLRTRRGPGKWSKPTLLWLWYDPDGNRFDLVGIEHLD
jgi:hypothetical protein